MKDFAKKFYKSKQWQECRESFIKQRTIIDGGLCERCHKRLGYIVHHKIYLTPLNINDADITLNHCNLEYVCKECHDLEHFIQEAELNCTFDENGMPIDARKI